MFILLHHKISGNEFFVPASQVVFVDEVSVPNKMDVRAPGTKTTHVHTLIAKGNNTLTFEVQESPQEVADRLNEMLNIFARAGRSN